MTKWKSILCQYNEKRNIITKWRCIFIYVIQKGRKGENPLLNYAWFI